MALTVFKALNRQASQLDSCHSLYCMICIPRTPHYSLLTIATETGSGIQCPCLKNSPSPELRSVTFWTVFKSSLKTYLFRLVFNSLWHCGEPGCFLWCLFLLLSLYDSTVCELMVLCDDTDVDNPFIYLCFLSVQHFGLNVLYKLNLLAYLLSNDSLSLR